MCAGTYEKTHEKILESGKKMFLSDGYERTNLRDLCKDAGVTTGAFYRHFTDKSALFSALVEPVARRILLKYDAAEAQCLGYIDAGNFDELWTVTEETIAAFIHCIYDQFDEFKLLLCCADGTKYVNFLNEMVEREVQATYRMYAILEKNGVPFRRLDENALHMLTHAYFSCIFETVLHDYEKQEALQSTHILAEFFSAGWRKILCV